MVLTQTPPPPSRPGAGPTPPPSLGKAALRVAIWAAMVAAIGWTLLYRAAQTSSGLPEFVYVNF